jgi:hypothetical protein
VTAKTCSARSSYAGLLPIEPSDDFFRPIDLKPEPIDLNPADIPFPHWQPSARTRPLAPARFMILIAFCTGVATAMLWQSYGDAAREMIANLYSQLGRLATLTAQNRHTPDVMAALSPEQLNAMSVDLDVLGRNVDTNATTVAADREPTARSTDEISQEPTTRGTDQTAADQAQVKSPDDAAPLQPAARLREERPPQTLAEKRKPLSAKSGRDDSCFASASAVLQNHPAGWPTWTLRAPGQEGTMCWYAAARPRGSDHRSERMPKENEAVGPAEHELFVPVTPYGRGGSWEGGPPGGGSL